MSIELIGVALMPILVYMVHKKYYLNQSQLTLIISSIFMLISLVFDGWVTYIAYLVLGSWQMIVLFSMSKLTYFFDRNKSTHQFSNLIVQFFQFDEEDLILILYGIIIWIWVRVLSLQSVSFVFNGGTFLTVLKGWNCTLSEFWCISALWMIFSFLSGYACNFLIKNEHDRDNLYKSYIYKYKVVIDQACCTIVFAYNLIAYLASDKLQACLPYFEGGTLVRLIWFWGMPVSTIIFLYKKHGQFSIQSQSEHTQKQNELQQQLNRMQIDREHSKISIKSLHQRK